MFNKSINILVGTTDTCVLGKNITEMSTIKECCGPCREGMYLNKDRRLHSSFIDTKGILGKGYRHSGSTTIPLIDMVSFAV